MTGSDPGESAQRLFLEEGERTRGVWLPIALADIINLLMIVSRRAAGDTGEIKPLKRSEILRSWMLPAMAAAMQEDEEEQEAFELLKLVQNLNRK